MAKTETKVIEHSVARYRCTENVFQYCDTEPDWKRRPKSSNNPEDDLCNEAYNLRCKQNWHTCGHLRTLIETIKDLSMIS